MFLHNLKFFLFTLLSLFLISNTITAQTKLAGYVVEINSGKARVPGVNVKSLGANNIITTNQGLFTLVFPNAQPGNPVLISAQKEGWQVVNPKELNTILPEKPDALPLKITVCKAGYLENARKEYYKITDDYIVKEYKRRLQSINKEKEGWQKEVAELEEKLQSLNKQISEMAEDFSIINLDDLNETERKAIKLFKQGYIDSSISLRESLHSGEKIRNALVVKKQQDSVITASENNLKQLSKEYILKYDFANAEKTLKELANADTTSYNNALEFAYFLGKQRNHDKAIEYYRLCVRIARRSIKTEPLVAEFKLASALNFLGVEYHSNNNYAAAEDALSASLEIRRRQAKNYPNFFEPGIAETQNNLGTLYADKKIYPAAEAAFLEALDIRKRLSKTDSLKYEYEIAMVQTNLGNFYALKKNYPAAESAYLEALAKYKKSAEANPASFETYVAIAQNNLGIIYVATKNFRAAKAAYLQALDIRRRAAKTNPAAYEADVASTQNNLGLFYSTIQDYSAAETAYMEALKIRQQLSKNNPDTYEIEVARTKNNLGNLYTDEKKYPSANTAYLEALTIYKKKVAAGADEYSSALCRIILLMAVLEKEHGQLNNQAFIANHLALARSILISRIEFPEKDDYLYLLQNLENTFYIGKKLIPINELKQKIDEAADNGVKITLSQQLIRNYQSLIDSGYTQLAGELGSSYGNLAWYLLFEKKFADAERSAREALEPRTFKKNVDYDISINWVNTNLALALLFQGKYAEAEKIYLSFKDRPNGKGTYKDTFLGDIDEMEKAGITHKDVKKIRELLKK
ncbi:MAG: tetratricopeptide repeat protein [Chitinophagaceae bacterium]